MIGKLGQLKSHVKILMCYALVLMQIVCLVGCGKDVNTGDVTENEVISDEHQIQNESDEEATMDMAENQDESTEIQSENTDNQTRYVAGYAVENNDSDQKSSYPYVVHTESADWYLATDDIELLGENAYFTGLEEVLQNQEQDFADAREVLKNYLNQDVAPISIYTDFCCKADISKTVSAYYNDRSNFIKVFYDWDQTKATLLHEYGHYLTMHCVDNPPTEGFFVEGIADYVSHIACRNRIEEQLYMTNDDMDLEWLKEKGAWNTDTDSFDQRKYYYGMARNFANGVMIGENYFSVSDRMEQRTEEIQNNLDTTNICLIEAACIFEYMIETYSMDTVMQNLSMKSEDIEKIYGVTFSEIYDQWKKWNDNKCDELGIKE